MATLIVEILIVKISGMETGINKIKRPKLTIENPSPIVVGVIRVSVMIPASESKARRGV